MQWDFPLSGFEIGENMSSREVLISFPIGRHELFPPSKSGETEARKLGGQRDSWEREGVRWGWSLNLLVHKEGELLT